MTVMLMMAGLRLILGLVITCRVLPALLPAMLQLRH